MARPHQEGLTARESQIMDVLWTCGKSTVEEVRERLPVDLSGSSIRTFLAIMGEKGYVDFHKRGKAKVFRPLVAREQAQTSALRALTQRLFKGSTNLVLARLVEEEEISLEELDELRRQIKRRSSGG